MTDLQTIKDRLFFFIEERGISVRKFERMCGLSNGYVKGIRQSIQPDKLELIAEQFPMLSKSWLMTGEGEMLKTRLYESDEQEKVLTSEWYRGLLDEYNNVKEENKQLREENEALKNKETELMGMLKNALAVKAAEIKK